MWQTVTGVALGGAIVTGVVAAVSGNLSVTFLAMFFILAFFASCFGLIVAMERQLVPAEPTPARSSWRNALAGIALAYVWMPWVTWQSLTLREIEWRGVRYKFNGPWDIRLLPQGAATLEGRVLVEPARGETVAG